MKEQKTVLSTQVNGETAIVMPITKLECIEDTADSVDAASDTDYIPVIDSADNGQMKKITVGDFLSNLPAASETSSGLVNTEAQTFSGDKTFSGKLIPAGASDLTTAQARKIYAGTEDMTAGTSSLETGAIYLVYE